MIEITVGRHHYQEEILHPVDKAQEGIDYYEWTAEAVGNIANDIPTSTENAIVELVNNWDEDKIDIVLYNGCTLRVTGDLCYIELLDGDVSELLDKEKIQEQIKEGTL